MTCSNAEDSFIYDNPKPDYVVGKEITLNKPNITIEGGTFSISPLLSRDYDSSNCLNGIPKIRRRSPEGASRIKCVRFLAAFKTRTEISKLMGIHYRSVCRYIKLTEEEVNTRVAGCRKGSGKKKITSDIFDETLYTYISTLRAMHFPVHGLTVCESAKRLAMIPELETDSTKIEFTSSWGCKWLKRNNICLRRVSSTKADTVPNDWKFLKSKMIETIKSIAYNYNIPLKNIINADETPLFIESNYNYTYDSKYNNDSGIIQSCNKEKDRLSFMISINAEGHYITPYVVAKGRLVNKLVNCDVLSRAFVQANANAWFTTDLLKDYIINIIIPYACGEFVILIWDHFSPHYNPDIVKLCLENKIIIVLVPPHCTPVLQPLDISVNKALKNYAKERCEQYKLKQLYTNDISKNIHIVPPKRNNIIMDVINYMDMDKKCALNGFKKIGLFEETQFPKSLDDITYEGVFLINKKYTLKKNTSKKYVNIKDAIDTVSKNITIKTLLYNYFQNEESFSFYDFNNNDESEDYLDDEVEINYEGFENFYYQNANV